MIWLTRLLPGLDRRERDMWTSQGNPMPHLRLRRVALLVFVIVMVAGCTSPASDGVESTTTPLVASTGTTYVVQRGRIVRTLELDGRMVPTEETLLHFVTSGYVRQVYVQQGEQVSAGSLLAELDAGDLRNQTARAEAALNAAQEALSEAEQRRKDEIAGAELDLEVAQARLSESEEANAYEVAQTELALQVEEGKLGRLKALDASYAADTARALANLEYARAQAAGGLIDPNLAQRDLKVAQAEYERATANQSVNKSDISVQEIVVSQAEAEVERLREGVGSLLALEVQRAQQEVETLQGSGIDTTLRDEVDQAGLTLDRLREQLATAQIYAPVDGQVVYLLVYPGAPVEAYQTVLVVADPTQLEVQAAASDEQLRSLFQGQQVSVSPRTNSSQAYNATVRCLPYPYGACENVGDPAGSDQSLRIELADGANPLQMGALVRVTIDLEEKEDVLWLPLEAIRTFQEQDFVLVVEDGRQRRVNVTLGVRGQDRVEILDGLEDGQLVVKP
jgi:multidrug efflux pump subunit AcrA (membrane-fusion protein)